LIFNDINEAIRSKPPQRKAQYGPPYCIWKSIARGARFAARAFKALADAKYTAKTEELARRIAQEHGKLESPTEARIIAEADMAILNILRSRAKLLNAMPTDENNSESNEALPGTVRAPQISIGRSTKQSHLAVSYLTEIQQLLALDRYEQRAILRRRHALRQLCWLARDTPNFVMQPLERNSWSFHLSSYARCRLCFSS
jgi:hypothetical protein